MSETPKELWPMIRQYKHNDGSEGFVTGFAYEKTVQLVATLRAELEQLREAVKSAEAMPRDGDYGEGWDDCIKYIHAALPGEQD